MKLELLKYLDARPEPRDGAATMPAVIPQTWDMHDSLEIVDALKLITSNDEHSKVHRVFAQMRLFDVVQTQTENAIPKGKGSGRHVAEHLIVLEEMAKKVAGKEPPTSRAKIETRYASAYLAGKRWRQLVDWFGGDGIVLVFITRSKLLSLEPNSVPRTDIVL